MTARPIRVPTKIWLAACLVMLAIVPVFVPATTLNGFYRTPNSHRLQRHSFRNVAEGQPEARSPSAVHQSLPYLLSALSIPVFGHPSVSGLVQSQGRLLNLFPHRRKLGRASPGDPDSLI